MGSIEKLKKITDIVEWMDKARGGEDRGKEWIEYTYGIEIEGNHKVLLTHWLVYIMNRNKRVTNVFRGIKEKVAGLVDEYEQMLPDTDDRGIENLVDKHCKKLGYRLDQKKIARTLKILNRGYHGSLIQFFEEFIRKFQDDEEGLRRIAHVADLLSYHPYYENYPMTDGKIDELINDENNIESTLDVFKDEEKLTSDFREKEDNLYFVSRHKRLWAVLRDFRTSYLCDLVVKKFQDDSLGKKWNSPEGSFSLIQLELPGDTWNKKFSENLMVPLAEEINKEIAEIFPRPKDCQEKWGGYITYKKKGARYRRGDINKNAESPKFARALYNVLNEQYDKISFYPEQFDVSMDFASRMCGQYIPKCKICPFKNGASEICHKGHAKYCSVLLTSCGYETECDHESCPIKGYQGGLCKGSS